jgi:type IV pilus assembly protein PilN
MVNINLLPWREQEKKNKQRDFFVGMGVSVGVMVVLLLGIHIFIVSFQNDQTQRNILLKNEIDFQAVKLAKIAGLDAKKKKLLNKIKIIQGLERYRFGVVHIVDSLAKVVPDGIYLTQLTQTGNALEIKGKSRSNLQISRLMRSIENSLWLKSPQLQIIQAVNKERKDYMDDFKVNLKHFHNVVN